MNNLTQLDRYKKLLDFIDSKFKEELNIKDVEEVSFYSYRNINRIFQALQHETLGLYIKRIKLEKAAEYLKFSNHGVAEIADEIGYSDIAAFSKAFKKQFNCSPSAFRSTHDLKTNINEKAIYVRTKSDEFSFEVEEIPDIDVLYLTYHGAYDNIEQINETWRRLLDYTLKHNLLHKETIVLGEILDDNEITETIHCRYNAAVVLEKPLEFPLDGLFQSKRIAKQKYAKFTHKGSHESCEDTYQKIYSHWITELKYELEDKPTLEFYLNDWGNTIEKELITEIYIPIK